MRHLASSGPLRPHLGRPPWEDLRLARKAIDHQRESERLDARILQLVNVSGPNVRNLLAMAAVLWRHVVAVVINSPD